VKLSVDSLPGHLARDLKSAYLVSGDEPLLTGESADAVRRKAREAGFSERQVFFAERGFDWNQMRTESQTLSLFAERRILDVRLPTGKPGDGAELLEALVTQPHPDQLLLVTCGKLERATQQSAWVKAFERHGVWVQVWPVDFARLPEWIARRLERHQLEPDAEAARFLAERVEGNLLAAQQEIEKLALLVEPGRLDAASLAQLVADSARYDVFQLAEAALRGDAGRALHILDGLRGEGVEPTLALWAVSREIRALWKRLQGSASGRAPPAWQRNDAALEQAVGRAHELSIRELIQLAVRADRTIKGRAAGDPWDALERLVSQLAGAVKFPAAA
jgi:DNA polymerase-3 subunit delta